MKILFDKKVEVYLNELIDILYANNYFGFKESAYDYVDWIITSIEKDMETVQKKVAPTHFSKYGVDLFYSVFKRNNTTTWYVFYNYEDDLFYIRYIGNNHTCSQYI